MDIHLEPGWSQFLQQQFDLPYFRKLNDFVEKEYQTQTIYPPQNQIFNAFQLCPWNTLKVVILGQDPYIQKGQAHGLSFSVPDGIKFPPSLRNIFKEIESDLGKKLPDSGSLIPWAEQGVLLLNTVMTVRAGLSNAHQKMGWETFTDEVISLISREKSDVVFLLWGSYAQKKAALIQSQKHLILQSAHPSPLSAFRGFFGNKHFSLTNQFLESKGLKAINW